MGELMVPSGSGAQDHGRQQHTHAAGQVLCPQPQPECSVCNPHSTYIPAFAWRLYSSAYMHSTACGMAHALTMTCSLHVVLPFSFDLAYKRHLPRPYSAHEPPHPERRDNFVTTAAPFLTLCTWLGAACPRRTSVSGWLGRAD